nr:Tad domain-containing protein [Sphingomonas taxi]
MGGGALDLSRLYLIKTRMQQGCDAGVLAYRKSMQGTNVVPTTYPTALAYFNANFSPGRYGSFNTQFPQPSVDANVVVHGTASTSVRWRSCRSSASGRSISSANATRSYNYPIPTSCSYLIRPDR